MARDKIPRYRAKRRIYPDVGQVDTIHDIKELIHENVRYRNLGFAQWYDRSNMYNIYKAQREYGVEPVAWPASDLKLIMERAVPLWEQMGTYNERCAQLLAIAKEQARDSGLID